MSAARRLAEELGLAFSLLTRLKLPRFEIRAGADLATAFWAYPVAGAVVSGLSALALWAAWAATGEAMLAALVGLCAGFLATGGFHEDGLADFWDGLGGGSEPARRLEIMRDSRLGTYGALALFAALTAKLLLLSTLLAVHGLAATAAALVACGGLGRAAIAWPFATLPPCRDVGLAAQARRPPGAAIVAGVALAIGLAILLLGRGGGSALVGAAAGAVAVAWLARRYLGGFTGDVLGATALTAEIAALFALEVAW